MEDGGEGYQEERERRIVGSRENNRAEQVVRRRELSSFMCVLDNWRERGGECIVYVESARSSAQRCEAWRWAVGGVVAGACSY